MFYAREKELQILREKLRNERFESVLLYGRRRIGKTELIRQAAASFDGKFIYYECKRSLLGDNVEGFNALLRQIYGVEFSFSDLKSAVRYVFESAKKERTLLVIDELPFIMNEYPQFVSDLRDLIDEYKSSTPLKLILSGSYVDMMKGLNDGASETYGRFTGIMEIYPFDYYDSACFYPDYTEEEKFLMYSVFGGVAFFNSLIDASLSPLENILKLLIDRNSILQLEVEHTVSAETGKIAYVNSVIELVGNGVTKYSDISQILSSRSGAKVNPDYLLKKLLDMEILRRNVPINEPDNRKKTMYLFNDNLMEFYYRYIFRNKNANAVLTPENFFEELVRTDFETKYLPKMFEAVAREFLIRAGRNRLLQPVIYEVGTYSHNDSRKKINREFDVVTKDRNGYISYECKYTREPIGPAVINEEEYQIRDSGISAYKLGFISRSGFTDGIDREKYNLFSLKDFYLPELKYNAENG